MIKISDFVQTTIYDITPSRYKLPGITWSVLKSLNQVHSLWRWYRQGSLYSNPDNFVQLLGGHVINFALGESVLLRVAAQSLLISNRLLICVQLQASICQEGKHLIEAVKGHYPYPKYVSWSAHNYSYISPSSILAWKSWCCSLWHRTSRTIHITIRLIYKVFALSMCIMDAIDAFYISAATKNIAINESCLNAITWLDAVIDQKEELLQGLSENKEVIEIILKGSPFTYRQLKSAAESALTTAESFHSKTKKVTTFGNGLIVDLGKRSLHGAMVITGVKSLV